MSRGGRPLGNRYWLEKLVATRGNASVFSARDLRLNVQVEIEIYDSGSLGRTENVARFIGQIRAVAQLKGEHVRRILDVGVDTGDLYTVSEDVEGADLEEWLRRRGTLPVGQAVDFALHACEALAEAHGQGIIHRDIKPAHLFAVEAPGSPPSVQVAGWDLSTSLDGASTTEEETVVGTLLYMPPEALRRASRDERSDIWSLGMTLCELVAGDMQLERHSLMLTLVSDAPIPFPDAFLRLPPGLQSALRKCLETDRDQRYQRVAELAVALGEFGSERSKALVDRICAYPRRASP